MRREKQGTFHSRLDPEHNENVVLGSDNCTRNNTTASIRRIKQATIKTVFYKYRKKQINCLTKSMAYAKIIRLYKLRSISSVGRALDF